MALSPSGHPSALSPLHLRNQITDGLSVRNEYFTEHDGYAYRIIINDEWKCVNLRTQSVF